MNQSSTLHIKVIGQGSPIVMLHGWGWHSGVWEPIISSLSEHNQLFMVDLPGFGENRELILQHYDFETLAAAIFPHVPEQAIWLGWSLGGMLAWWVAIHYPEKINYLITLASSPRFSADAQWPGVNQSTLDKFAHALETDYEQTLLDFLALQLRGSQLPDEEKLTLQHQLFTVKKPHPSALHGGLALLRDTDLRKNINKVQCKSLHFFGSHDMLVPPAIVKLIQPQLVQGHCEIIPHCGHMPFLSPDFMTWFPLQQ